MIIYDNIWIYLSIIHRLIVISMDSYVKLHVLTEDFPFHDFPPWRLGEATFHDMYVGEWSQVPGPLGRQLNVIYIYIYI